MPNPISTPRPSESERKTCLEDRRADWERPTLRRLAAIEAQQRPDRAAEKAATPSLRG